jgi:hypothetical protein
MIGRSAGRSYRVGTPALSAVDQGNRVTAPHDTHDRRSGSPRTGLVRRFADSISVEDCAGAQSLEMTWPAYSGYPSIGAEPVLGLRLAVHVEDRVSVRAELGRRAAYHVVPIRDRNTTRCAPRCCRLWIGERAHSQDGERTKDDKHAFMVSLPSGTGE